MRGSRAGALAWAATKGGGAQPLRMGRGRRDFREHQHTRGRALQPSAVARPRAQGAARERLKGRRQEGQGWEVGVSQAAAEKRKGAADGTVSGALSAARAPPLLHVACWPGGASARPAHAGTAHSASPFTEAAVEGDRLEGKGVLRVLRGVLGGVAASAASCCCSRPVARRTTSTATLTFRGAPQMLQQGGGGSGRRRGHSAGKAVAGSHRDPFGGGSLATRPSQSCLPRQHDNRSPAWLAAPAGLRSAPDKAGARLVRVVGHAHLAAQHLLWAVGSPGGAARQRVSRVRAGRGWRGARQQRTLVVG